MEFRIGFVAALTIGLILTGCQYDAKPVTVVEYRPAAAAVTEKTAPDSQVFVLWRWTPVAPLSTQPTTRPTRQFAVEVEQVYAQRGSPLGFRRQNGELIAVAGATTKSLDEAHYTWRTRPGTSDRIEDRKRRADNFATAVGIAVVVVVVVVIVGFVVHENRHTLWDDVFNSD